MIITLKGANFASSNIGTLDSWLISKSLTGVTIDNTATSVKKGEAYKAVITLKENYTFPDTITVTMGGTDITSTYVTKTATTITINVPSVTGNIVIRVNATSVGASTDQYKITYNLKGVHMYNTTTAVDKNSTYLSAIDILTNSALSSSPAVSYTVTMGGTTLTQGTDYTIGSTDVTNTKLLTINEVTGDVNIKIESLHSTTGSTALDAGKWPSPRQSVGSAIQYYPTITSDSSTLMYMTIPSNVHVYTYMNNVRITGTSEYSSIVLTDANDKVLEYYTFNNSSRGHDFKSYSTETKLYYHSSMITISYFWAANTNTLASYTIKANPSAATINVNKLSGMSAPCARCNGNLTVSAAVGTAITYGVGLEGYTAQSETITLTQSGTTSKVVTLVKEETGSGEEPDDTMYNSADMWVSQTISSAGVVSTSGITQSNIMAKSKFAGSATITATGEAMQMALVTYNDDGSFKARGTWDSLASGSSKTYTDENPFNVVIATKATNTSYTVEEMVAMLNIVGVSEESLWDGTVYSDSPSYWVRQSMDSSGNIIPSDNATYNRSNLMAATKFNEPIKITAKSIKLMTAIITYDAQGNFLARSSWGSPGIGESVAYSDVNPFNVIIASNAESSYSLEEMLSLIDVRSDK